MVLHFDAHARAPLPEQLEAFHAEHLFGLKDPGALDIVAGQSLLRPFSGELPCVLLYLIELAIEPVVGLFGNRVDAIAFLVVAAVLKGLGREWILESEPVPEARQSSGLRRWVSGLESPVRRGLGRMEDSITGKPTAVDGVGGEAGREKIGHGVPTDCGSAR